jgi:hypothetical protein
MTEAVEKTFQDAQAADLEAVMIIGLTKNGGLNIQSSLNNVALMHWMLNKSIFDINVFERQPAAEEKAEA